MSGKYDVIIIGTGLGGLVCGYILSKNGLKVALIEKNSLPGGCLQTFIRKDVKFETGMHYIGSMDEGQPLHRYFKYLSLDQKVQLSRLDQAGYDMVSYQGERYAYANGQEPFTETLARHFPREKNAIKMYIHRMEAIAERSPLYSFRNMENPYWLDSSNMQIGVAEYIHSLTGDYKLQNVLAGIMPLYGGVAEKTPLYYHALITDFYNKSAFRFVGGSDIVVQLLCDSIRSFGGSIITGQPVTKVNFDDTKATGVTLLNNEFIEAGNVISDIHPGILMDMTDTPLIRKAYKQRIRRIRQTLSNFTVYIKFREKIVPYLNYNFYHYPRNSVWEGHFFYMHMCDQPHQQYVRSAVLFESMSWNEVERWKDLPLGNRGAEYEDFKAKKAHQMLLNLEKQFPGTISHIEDFWTSTPLTYSDYTGTVEGSMYGILRDKNDHTQTFISHRTKVPNLFLAGQNINAHGIMGVIIGSVLTCGEIIDIDNLTNQIKKA
ncbi:MAG: NAD(P)/FAD-dependent oxidoreductase [Bacteroidales bacterium]|jgi:all-trans-retinol 13,14-reductase|nr:NAD(P)/FAD-dependent oxidoreductase [Bacteroidales bacterium]MDD2264298.1 NAD(P)/FAD-dependent oxidoreductase [Bacteroidales bacterium]MDD2831532.1 NAD(P)/FAD-dependent oxidoreductase [Bacteroidales bacterium]MDD3208526.1 NAD(P)/FAD-dependent oxidoreductase [Bacteroidales bacterium]MDD3697061.1 NAD(P)/FAD-dependent oxidoreductase [Bacteroidales bacterium]